MSAVVVAVGLDVLDCIADHRAEGEVSKPGLNGLGVLLHKDWVLFNNLVFIG